MGKTIASLVLVSLVVAILLNGYNAEDGGRGNQLKKDDAIYKSQKFGQCLDCTILYNICLVNPYLWTLHDKFCSSNDYRSNKIASSGKDAPQVVSDLP
ncbi:hypothetical protein MtrunA17_Chr8g0339001 [Medicago truncatula]|uniref:RALF-like protein n=1 Tax=Medicago truncatula TaxID=3880 RepID=A0A072TKR2_MEDTR|nr:RALF-like protein [Medicago truncatula]RHN38984.1 hypothetical protein MtrunA17_Chr8g0339001 [Medicago truncatula]